jgi:hypothetical protein
MGQLDSGIHLVEDVARRGAHLACAHRPSLAVVTQTTLAGVDDAANPAYGGGFHWVRKPNSKDYLYHGPGRRQCSSPRVDIRRGDGKLRRPARTGRPAGHQGLHGR